jgi:trk system potassium uptake protein TrkA
MNIVILGAGTVGTSIARFLCAKQCNVSLVDQSRKALDEVEERLDVQTVHGSACDSVTLFQAGVQSADLCIAVTDKDEVNLVGASLAKAMGARRSLSRILNHSYLDYSTFDYQRHFRIDRLLSLEHLTALELAKAIRMPGLVAIENLARGGVAVQELAVADDAKVVGVQLKDLELPKGVRVGLISNEENTFIAGATDVIKAGCHVTLIGEQEKIDDVTRMFEHKRPPRIKVVIAGGGSIGFNLAKILQRGQFNVTLLEANAERCEYLAKHLPETTVLLANASSRSELEEARVGKADVFVATMGRDEDNIICGVEASVLGCGRILGVVRRPDYGNVLPRVGIDVAISPRDVMTQQVLGMVEIGPIISRSNLAGGVAEVWEIEILPNAPITQSPLQEFDFHHSLIAAIVREDYVKVPGADDILQPGDTAIVLVQKESVAETFALFEPAQ